MIEVQRETTCECRACRAIPDLDLKFVAHFGEYALQTVAGKQKPTGSSVTLAHRLLKNSVTAKTSWAAYALFTRAVFEQIGATPEGLHTADEAYKHLGQVSTLAVDLNSRVAAIEESAHVSVDPAQAPPGRKLRASRPARGSLDLVEQSAPKRKMAARQPLEQRQASGRADGRRRGEPLRARQRNGTRDDPRLAPLRVLYL